MISIGIDVLKGKSMVCIMKMCGEVVKPSFDISHTASELDSLVSLIKSFDEETRVFMEDTDHYQLLVAAYLSSHNIFVRCVNALCMKKFCSQSIRRAKTEKLYQQIAIDTASKIDIFLAVVDLELLKNGIEEAEQFAKDYIDCEEKEYQRMIDEFSSK